MTVTDPNRAGDEARRRSPPWTPQQLAGLTPVARLIHLTCPSPGLCLAECGVLEGLRCGPCETAAGLTCTACNGTALEGGAPVRTAVTRPCPACRGSLPRELDGEGRRRLAALTQGAP